MSTEQTLSPHDWPEDAEHENGNYFCYCCLCGTQFVGHKRRVCCKVCAQPDVPYESPFAKQYRRAFLILLIVAVLFLLLCWGVRSAKASEPPYTGVESDRVGAEWRDGQVSEVREAFEDLADAEARGFDMTRPGPAVRK